MSLEVIGHIGFLSRMWEGLPDGVDYFPQSVLVSSSHNTDKKDISEISFKKA